MNSMLNRFREYLLSYGIKESTADVYLSILRSSSKKKGSKISGWSSVSQWVAKFILEDDVSRLDVPKSIVSKSGLFLADPLQSTKSNVVHIFCDDTIDDIASILTMQLDDESKVQIIETYISSRKRDLGDTNG
jgi:hypothetical protein